MNVPQANAGEVFAGAITSPAGVTTHIYLLPGEFKGPWKKSMEWAAEQGGELPNRVESALLFAHLKDKFQKDWYWTREECGSAFAWCQDFDYGLQYDFHKDNHVRARAVRRLIIE